MGLYQFTPGLLGAPGELFQYQLTGSITTDGASTVYASDIVSFNLHLSGPGKDSIFDSSVGLPRITGQGSLSVCSSGLCGPTTSYLDLGVLAIGTTLQFTPNQVGEIPQIWGGVWQADVSIPGSGTDGYPLYTPLPAALPLFASGLGALGLLSWRRKRKLQPAMVA